VTQGLIKRRRAAILAQERSVTIKQIPVCALCDRPIPPALRDAHHLIPKSRGGVLTVDMHRACHKQIHALFTETELARNYPSLEALRAHPEMVRFTKWVRGKPSEFNPPTRRSRKKGLS
jgi:5-methylcytosine-specific restriction endonuclease McrA